MSDWNYHTNVQPRKQEINSEYKNEFEQSFKKFIDEYKLPIDKLNKELKNNNMYYLEIDTKDNIINKNSNYHVSFLKSKFIVNPRFKRELIEYYNPIGYFINGPTQIQENIWIINIKKKIPFK
jgi:hypothetical protein